MNRPPAFVVDLSSPLLLFIDKFRIYIKLNLMGENADKIKKGKDFVFIYRTEQCSVPTEYNSLNHR
jgi:hypothetical protein